MSDDAFYFRSNERIGNTCSTCLAQHNTFHRSSARRLEGVRTHLMYDPVATLHLYETLDPRLGHKHAEGPVLQDEKFGIPWRKVLPRYLPVLRGLNCLSLERSSACQKRKFKSVCLEEFPAFCAHIASSIGRTSLE